MGKLHSHSGWNMLMWWISTTSWWLRKLFCTRCITLHVLTAGMPQLWTLLCCLLFGWLCFSLLAFLIEFPSGQWLVSHLVSDERAGWLWKEELICALQWSLIFTFLRSTGLFCCVQGDCCNHLAGHCEIIYNFILKYQYCMVIEWINQHLAGEVFSCTDAFYCFFCTFMLLQRFSVLICWAQCKQPECPMCHYTGQLMKPYSRECIHVQKCECIMYNVYSYIKNVLHNCNISKYVFLFMPKEE